MMRSIIGIELEIFELDTSWYYGMSHYVLAVEFHAEMVMNEIISHGHDN